jgi:hypothetical protein
LPERTLRVACVQQVPAIIPCHGASQVAAGTARLVERLLVERPAQFGAIALERDVRQLRRGLDRLAASLHHLHQLRGQRIALQTIADGHQPPRRGCIDVEIEFLGPARLWAWACVHGQGRTQGDSHDHGFPHFTERSPSPIDRILTACPCTGPIDRGTAACTLIAPVRRAARRPPSAQACLMTSTAELTSPASANTPGLGTLDLDYTLDHSTPAPTGASI